MIPSVRLRQLRSISLTAASVNRKIKIIEMKIVILTAMDKEMQLIVSILSNPTEGVVDEMKVVRGEVCHHEVTVAKCGIGKVNAAVNTYRIILSEKPDLVINSGVAGGAGLPVGSVLVADRVAYDDVWCGPGTEYGEADGCPLYFTPSSSIISLAKSFSDNPEVRFGLICSGDKFISSAEEIMFIRSHFPDVMAVDMESAAIAQVCRLTSTEFNIVRVVSDTPGEGENLSQYQNFWTEAPVKTFGVVRALIENLK